MSWQPDTAYLRVHQHSNPALGQCYPTSRVVQLFFPSFEIASGQVKVGSSLEAHFWNIDPTKTPIRHVDLTWQQFSRGAEIISFEMLDRDKLNDSPPTVQRCELLLQRVLSRLGIADATRGRFKTAR
jgi:hypothetical protein